MAFFKKFTKDASASALEQKGAARSKKTQPAKAGEISVQNRKSISADWLKTKGHLTVDVYQTEKEFSVQAPIGGMEPENISIAVENEMLVIKGERQEPEPGKEKEHFYQECYWGPFSRRIILPEDVDIKNIKATLKKGLLNIKIPRTQIANKEIKVEVKE